MYRLYFKRFIDLVVSLTLLIISLPIMATTCICLLIANKGTPFFVQKRPGYNSIVFNIIKFKTMNDKRNNNGELLSDAERLTKFGAVVRKTSLDELPQLFNVLKGDMSLIGPRPLLEEYLPLYSKEQSKRHSVKPGITGWAQVNGRNSISWEKKFDFDLYYVCNLSFKLDLIILVKTFNKVIKRADISSQTHVTMEKFNGKN